MRVYVCACMCGCVRACVHMRQNNQVEIEHQPGNGKVPGSIPGNFIHIAPGMW